MGIKRNVYYSSLLTTSNYIFPLVVYPYVSRVLGVTNIGLCNFIDNIINYFILISMMGINIMGNRQMATDRANGISLNQSFSPLLILNAISTSVAVMLLIISIYVIPEFHQQKELMWYGVIRLVSNFMLIEWFYKGIEDFKFITYRSILVKCLYVATIFIFVKTREDYAIYYLLTVLVVAANSIINTCYARKFVKFQLKGINLKPLLKPFFILGIYMLVTSLCTSFNVVYLGFVTDDTEVGYYTTAIKLYTIILAFFTGITGVILPRMSNLLASNKFDEFKEILIKSTSILFAFFIPVVIYCVIYAPQIIMLISGPGYEGSITPMRIVMPLMLIVGYEQITVIQGLMPLKADRAIMINASAGALVSIVLNLVLVYKLKSIGSAIACVSAEFTILILSLFILKKQFNIRFSTYSLIKTLLVNIPLIFFLLLIYYFNCSDSYVMTLIMAGIVFAMYTFITQCFILKNPVFTIIANRFFKRI